MRRMFTPQDTVVDKLAKLLSPADCVNWHNYRPCARGMLEEIGVEVPPESLDREVTREELHAYRDAMPLRIHSW